MAKAEKKKRTSKVPENETAEQRTKRLTEFRVGRLMKDFDSVINLAGAAYTLSLDQKAEIMVAVEAKVKETRSAFAGQAMVAARFQLSK